MSRTPSNANAVEAQLIAAFWECYIPRSSSAQDGSPCAWLQQSICLPNPPPALHLSLKALAMTRLGSLHKDDSLVRGGRVVYGNALRELHKALYDKHSMWRHETMATCNVLALYELSESSPASIVGYNSHVEALTHLLTMRGSERYRYDSALAQAIFEETRLKTMLQSLVHRKASPLGSHEWCTRPWYQERKDQSQKDILQRLYDHGFALAALLEQIDIANLADDDANPEAIQKYLRRCSVMDARLNLWYQELVRGSDGPVYWLTPLNDSVQLGPSHVYWASVFNNNRPFSFPNLRIAHIITFHWALKLAVSSTIASICSTLLSVPASPARKSLQITAHQLLTQHGEKGRLENATNIMRSMPYCLHDSMGLLGAQKSLFVLRASLLSLRRSQNEELKLCAQMYRELYERKGLGYAMQVADMGPKWGIDPEEQLAKICIDGSVGERGI
ncbi:MAG: hypothetical protein ALECFALPRED_003124 [Alectoria fallacina]|uniref:Uncharacterized protein n=1 Tax=Alectoria fallacina TaxID=1903189 RepID=A0A8H3FG76_9LECA|nr:MAG: hypothetical protein ALECFALPRED_003124 [Alectoria fallacina]